MKLYLEFIIMEIMFNTVLMEILYIIHRFLLLLPCTESLSYIIQDIVLIIFTLIHFYLENEDLEVKQGILALVAQGVILDYVENRDYVVKLACGVNKEKEV